VVVVVVAVVLKGCVVPGHVWIVGPVLEDQSTVRGWQCASSDADRSCEE
jgi:hypothetical protein